MDIERLRELCLSLPETSEAIKYGDQLCFLVGGRTFCSSNLKTLEKVNLKVDDEAFDEWCERPGIGPAPYGGARHRYIQVAGFNFLSEKEWEEAVARSYQIIRDLPQRKNSKKGKE